MKRQIKLGNIKTTKDRTESNSQNARKDPETKEVRKSAQEEEIKHCQN
jgi:hypothetical protein